jgi:hypothetical protein
MLGGGCPEPRRPTPEEIERWNRQADVTVAVSILWEIAALSALSFGLWDLFRRWQGPTPSWPRSVGVLMLIMGGVMLVPSATLARLWAA